MPTATELIKRDHRHVEDLFTKFEQSNDTNVLMDICNELDVHTAMEEAVVYPAIEDGVPEGKKMISEANDEHKEARQLIGRIKNTSDEQHLAALASELKQAVEHHVREEEDEVLPKTEQALGQQRMQELGEEVEQFKAANS
jgi:iron-sulfur cluster repair protein YtfE (RIC family)